MSENGYPIKGIMLMHCPDQKGIIAAVTAYFFDYGANIVELDQYVDPGEAQFFMRLAWEVVEDDSFEILTREFKKTLAAKFDATVQFHLCDRPHRIAVFVTSVSHCLYDIIQRCESTEWNAQIKCVISNKEKLKSVADRFEIPFHHLPVNRENKLAQEKEQIKLLRAYSIDVVVLARYMQILTGDFVELFPNMIINIHHSFLPAFPGARPYHSAHSRGVKVIGATSHFVTQELDAGPIIAQGVREVSHHHSIQDLIRIGKDVEKIVLAEALRVQLQYRVLVYRNRTVVFK